jgi:hypothetical protein
MLLYIIKKSLRSKILKILVFLYIKIIFLFQKIANVK